MKIAHIVCTFPLYKGGMGNSAFNFCKHLATLDNEITVFTPDYQGKGHEEITNGIQINRLKPLFSYGNAAILPQLIYKLNNFDIIHLHYPFFGSDIFVILAIIFKNRPKLIVHYHMDTIATGWLGILFWLNRLLILPIILRLANKITVASLDYIENSQVNNYFIHHNDKFIETLFGVDEEKFSLNTSINRDCSALFVGGLDKAHYFKGIDVLLEATSIIKRNNLLPNFKLNIIGNGDLLPIYKLKTQKLNISDIVNFLGNIDDCVPSYQQCGVFVLPSINQGEAFGLVLLEAMACGSPVVASDLPGVRGVFNNTEQGYTFTKGDPNDLANKITLVLSNKIKYENVCRNLIISKYLWPNIAKKINELYKSVL